jgi:hypothetical protein
MFKSFKGQDLTPKKMVIFVKSLRFLVTSNCAFKPHFANLNELVNGMISLISLIHILL